MATVTLANCPVPYTIAWNPGASYSSEPGATEAELGFYVAGADHNKFIAFAGGLPQTINTSFGPVTRYVPLSHPDTDYPNLLCSKIKSTAIGTLGSNGKWSQAKVMLTFSNVSYAADGTQPFLSRRTRASAEVYTLAGAKLAFSDGSPVQADAGITVPTLAYTYMLYNCGALDDDLVSSLLGKVNSTAIFGKAPGTVRCDSMNADETYTAGRVPVFNRELVLTHRAIEWNKFLTPNCQWQYALKPDGSYVYDSANLNQLFA